MNYNAEKILNNLNKFYFPYNFKEEDTHDLFACCFRDNYTMDSGATKCVIIPENEDYVIKIPYMGSGNYYSGYYDSDNYYHRGVDFYESFQCADNDERDWDYCGAEVKRYNIAIENNMEKFFAKSIFIGYTDSDYPIYLQEKCFIFSNNVNIKCTNEELTSMRKTVSSFGGTELPLKWLVSFVKKYNMETLIDFIYFLNKNGWNNDLRGANVGYLNHSPVLIDYSGFYE